MLSANGAHTSQVKAVVGEETNDDLSEEKSERKEEKGAGQAKDEGLLLLLREKLPNR